MWTRRSVLNTVLGLLKVGAAFPTRTTERTTEAERNPEWEEQNL